MIYLIVNSEDVPCKCCGEIFPFFTKSTEDSNHHPCYLTDDDNIESWAKSWEIIPIYPAFEKRNIEEIPEDNDYFVVEDIDADEAILNDPT